MKKTYFFTLISALVLLFFSCNDEEKYWEPTENITLGAVSVKIPDGYKKTDKTGSNKIEYGNDVGGNLISIVRIVEGSGEAHYAGYNPTVSDFRFSNGTVAKQYEGTIQLTENMQYMLNMQHTIVAYVFEVNGTTYALEFSWGPDNVQKSKQLMNDVLATLTIN